MWRRKEDEWERAALRAEQEREQRHQTDPDRCTHRLHSALQVLQAYGSSLRPKWHWPWRRKSRKIRKLRQVEENLDTVDHCAAIAETEEIERSHLRHRRRRRRRARTRRVERLDDAGALRALTYALSHRRSARAGHARNLRVIRWGRRVIHQMHEEIYLKKVPKTRRRWKRSEGETELEEEEEEEGAPADEDEEGDEGDAGGAVERRQFTTPDGARFKYTKRVEGYSRDIPVAGGGKGVKPHTDDHFYENISFEAEHPKKGRYTKKTLVEHKFEGPKDSEWREKAPKLPKNEDKAWKGKFRRRRPAADSYEVRGRGRRSRNRRPYLGQIRRYVPYNEYRHGSYSPYGDYADYDNFDDDHWANRPKKSRWWSKGLKILGIVLLVMFLIIII